MFVSEQMMSVVEQDREKILPGHLIQQPAHSNVLVQPNHFAAKLSLQWDNRDGNSNWPLDNLRPFALPEQASKINNTHMYNMLCEGSNIMVSSLNIILLRYLVQTYLLTCSLRSSPVLRTKTC